MCADAGDGGTRTGHPGGDGQPPLHLRHGGRGALQRQVVRRINSANAMKILSFLTSNEC